MRNEGSGLTTRGRQWLAIVREWERSGLGVREFCAQRGLKQTTFLWWRQQLKGQQPERRGSGGVEFVEIAHNGRLSDTMFHVELGNGLRVRVPTRFDAAALKELLVVLASC